MHTRFALTIAMIGAVTAYALDERRKREEEKAQEQGMEMEISQSCIRIAVLFLSK